MSGQFSGAVFGRAAEAPEEVVVGRAVVETKGLQPEDLGVLVYLLLLSAGNLASAKDLAAGMRSLGWKMSVDRFEVVAKRLMQAGHLTRESVYDSKSKRPQWRYWAYRNPANNPEYVRSGTGALSQVTGEVGENPVSSSVDAREIGENPISPGQGRNRGFPEFGESLSRSSGVPAGHGRNGENPGSAGHPPHPPEEVDTSSPYPLTSSSIVVPSQREEGAVEFSTEDIQAAERFLQTMKQPWNAGRATARKCTPLLLRVMTEQGWPSIQQLSDTDRRLLERDLTKNPEGISRFSQVLPKRIADLALYDAVARRPRPQSTAPAGVDVLREERTPTTRSLTELLEQMNKPCP